MITREPGSFAPKNDELLTDAGTIKKAADLVKAVDHPARQSLLRVISREREITVTALRLEVNMEQPVASSHLAVLRRAGVVATRRAGNRVLYSVRQDRLQLLHQGIQKFVS